VYTSYGLSEKSKVHCLLFQVPAGPASYVRDYLFGKTWSEAKVLFEQRYGDRDAIADAADEFDRCHQSDRMPVSAFLTDFEA
jgi:hypothetical protein